MFCLATASEIRVRLDLGKANDGYECLNMLVEMHDEENGEIAEVRPYDRPAGVINYSAEAGRYFLNIRALDEGLCDWSLRVSPDDAVSAEIPIR